MPTIQYNNNVTYSCDNGYSHSGGDLTRACRSDGSLSGSTPICNSKLQRGSNMIVHVLLNLLNELEKRDKMRGLPSILSLFRNEFNKFNNTRVQMLDSIYHMTL